LKNNNRTLTTAWKNGLEGILNSYLGTIPEEFEYNGKNFTPKSYIASLGINLDDYVDITSFTHHPFYQKMTIEVPDNWMWATSYNVPIDDLIAIMYNALNNGYTVAWGSDVSEKGFTRKGLGIVPDMEKLAETGSDQAKWIGLTPAQKNDKATEAPCAELVITQEMRQEAFDNYQTTDDHGMHIYGIAKDQNGKKYFMVKNSWGDAGDYKGFWYVSEAFVRYKTMDIMVNKNAIPAEIRAKLGL
jgi:aminopeptidase C